MKLVGAIPIAVPAPAEQRTMVDRIESLLVLCDDLDTAQRASETIRVATAAAAVRSLTASTGVEQIDADTFRNRARFVIHHCARLITRPDHLTELRRALLMLAVLGKLTTSGAPHEDDGLTTGHLSVISDAFPLHWQRTRFSDIAVISGGFAFKSEDYAPTGVFVLRVTNIASDSTISRTEAVYLARDKVTANLEAFYLNEGEILLVMVGGSLGKVGVVSRDVLPALLNQNLWRITPASDDVDQYFLRLLVKYLVAFQPRITQSTHGHYSREEFRSIPVALPPIVEQKRIVLKLDELMAVRAELEASLEAMQSQRSRFLESILDGYLARGDDTLQPAQSA